MDITKIGLIVGGALVLVLLIILVLRNRPLQVDKDTKKMFPAGKAAFRQMLIDQEDGQIVLYMNMVDFWKEIQREEKGLAGEFHNIKSDKNNVLVTKKKISTDYDIS